MTIRKTVLRSLGVVAVAGFTLIAADCGGRIASEPSARPQQPATTLTTPTTPTTTSAAPAPSTTVTPATTRPSADAGAIPIPTASTIAPANPSFIRPGDQNDRVTLLQLKLKELGYDPGPIDAQFGPATQNAVWAFQRVNGLLPDAVVGDDTMAALGNPKAPKPMRPDGPPTRVEVSVSNQLLVAYRDGNPIVITHISTGSQVPFCENGVCGDAVTPTGDYHVLMKIDGWENGPLGAMYNSVYFYPAYAIHGAYSVPDVGLSHGCVRIPIHIADYFPSLVTIGEAVLINP